jgi:hypothetical protein
MLASSSAAFMANQLLRLLGTKMVKKSTKNVLKLASAMASALWKCLTAILRMPDDILALQQVPLVLMKHHVLSVSKEEGVVSCSHPCPPIKGFVQGEVSLILPS